jgi:hypothetical protein
MSVCQNTSRGCNETKSKRKPLQNIGALAPTAPGIYGVLKKNILPKVI